VRIAGPDHTNWRVRDLADSLVFYEGVLGLEPFGLDEYRQGERSLVSLRVTEDFILHLIPDSEFEPGGGYDHLALRVEGSTRDETIAYLQSKGVEIEERFDSITGARGQGPALYVRDPDGYRIELKFY
jgi:catechol 2,3-dioxygenase-like lactoylglutathione lyase family enzyme